MKHTGLLFLGLLFLPFFTSANVVINEIAWMGTSVSTADEWMELKNTGIADADLSGWILEWKNGDYKINFSEKCPGIIIPAGAYFLLERTDDTTVPDVAADCIYTGALSNAGEKLILRDNGGNAVNTIDASGGWPAGDNTTKQTMQLSGSNWTTATATPKAGNANVSEPQLSVSGGGNDAPYIPPEKLPKIKSYAGEDRAVVVGANTEFRGQAFGLDNEPLNNARYLWTFGDGFTKEGKNITHFYRYPGEYIAVLNVSSGEYSASDQLLIKAIPNQVFISELKIGERTWIELENKSKEEIDISETQIKSGNQIFILPKSSRIRPFSFLTIPVSDGGFIVYSGKGSVELSYPGGFKADKFDYDGFPSGAETFNRDGEKIFIAEETPGTKNKISTLAIQKSKTDENKKSTVAEFVKPIILEVEPPLEVQPHENINVAAVVESKPKSNTAIYLFVVAGLILFSCAAVFFIRRKSGV